VFGIADIHSHLNADAGFGGAGVFHGSAFHPLGIEHALPSCEAFHGVEGRSDLFGAAFDASGAEVDTDFLIQGVLTGQTPGFNHATAGYPDFTQWPSAFDSSTHQVQYYKWLERAYQGGLRLVVQHAVNNQIICDFLVNGNIQPGRHSCNDMVNADSQIDATYAMQDYIDAQEGGPGEGWFRIVTSPEQARDVINDGKMAVVLGIEVSTLFNCFLNPSDEFPACDQAHVTEQLDEYYNRGIRVLFPAHKFDNAFTAGDGDKAFIEIGNLLQNSHFSNFTQDCDLGVPGGFDSGPISFPGLNQPRDDYFATPTNDFSNFFVNPLLELAPLLGALLQPAAPADQHFCQAAGMTTLGEFLINSMISRGMIIDVDHLPRRSYKRAMEILEANDYPASGSHGRDDFGRLFALGGVTTTGFAEQPDPEVPVVEPPLTPEEAAQPGRDYERCRTPGQSNTVANGYLEKVQQITDNGGFPALGFGFDLNGFAGAPGPRFGENSVCFDVPQEDPLTYPFTSYDGSITFSEPTVGNRTIDFNTEGLAHIGLLPDLIEDTRRDGVSDEALIPLFKSAEGYIRMWEKAERRSREINQAP